jgi:hypothetical protein
MRRGQQKWQQSNSYGEDGRSSSSSGVAVAIIEGLGVPESNWGRSDRKKK